MAGKQTTATSAEEWDLGGLCLTRKAFLFFDRYVSLDTEFMFVQWKTTTTKI